MEPRLPVKVNDNKDYIDYELDWELPPLQQFQADELEQSVMLRISLDRSDHRACAVLIHEICGEHEQLCETQITLQQFYQITGHPYAPEDILSVLRNVTGPVSIANGIATLEDGTTIQL